MVGVGLAVVLVSCSDATDPDPAVEPPEIELMVDASSELQQPPAPAGSIPVAGGLFMTIPASTGQPPIPSGSVADRARQILEDTNEFLAQCGLHFALEAVQVIGVPSHLVSVQGNVPGSWGGHPPDNVGDPDLFTYYEDERLPADARELFAYGKRHTSKNAIGVFVVEEIEYYIGYERTPASGLSFPPVVHHHVDDYPFRNSVLVEPTDRDASGVPSASGRVAAHELGHMLLNTGDHWGEGFNLMLGGTDLTTDQCDRMRKNRERLFGDAAMPDPGPPETGTAIAMVSGNNQVGKAGEPLERPFAVRVTDAQGEGVRHVHVTWSVTSGAGHFGVRPASRTDSDGVGGIGFLPTTLGTTTVTAEVAGLEGSPVTFSLDAPMLVIKLRRPFNGWLGWGDPVFSGPEGGSEVDVPVGTTVEWSVTVETAHIASTSEPPGGQSFDSEALAEGDRFQFVPDVAGTWEFEDRISGATGSLTAR
jgi:hypothetical protein